jgi:hypothetical protein
MKKCFLLQDNFAPGTGKFGRVCFAKLVFVSFRILCKISTLLEASRGNKKVRMHGWLLCIGNRATESWTKGADGEGIFLELGDPNWNDKQIQEKILK